MLDIISLFHGIGLLADPGLILLLLAGIFIGFFLGALPGITTSLCLSLLLPFAIELPIQHGFLLMLSVYTSTVVGAGVMSILFNVPGNPGAIATALDGYPMTRNGKGQQALSTHVMASAAGNIFGWTVVACMFIPLSEIARSMENVDVLFVTIFVVVLVGVMGSGSMTKSLLSGAFGLIATLFNVPFNDHKPLEIGFITYGDTIPLMVMLVGVFSAPELFKLVRRKNIACCESSGIYSAKTDIKSGLLMLVKYRWTVIRSSLVGLFVGLLPAGGGALSSMSAYFLAKKVSREKASFGEGNVEGIVAAECSNSAAICGAISMLLILGIPSSNSASIIYGLMIETGASIESGYYLGHLELVYAVICAGILISVILTLFSATLIPYITRIANIDTKIILPVLLALIFGMSYFYRGYNGDVICLILFSIIGILMSQYHYPSVSFVLGLLLGKKIELGVDELSYILSSEPELLMLKPVTMFAMIAVVYLLLKHIISLIPKSR